MKVLMVPSWYPSSENRFNGSFFQEQASFLRDAGHEVVVLAPQPIFITSWRGAGFCSSVEEGIRVLRFKVPSWPIGLRYLEKLHYVFIRRYLLRFLAESGFHPDILHCHSIYPALLIGFPLATHLKIPLMLTEHRPSSLERPRWGVRGRLLEKAVKGAQIRSSVSQAFLDELSAHWGSSWDLLELPVMEEFFSLPIQKADKYTLLHVSHLDCGKRVDDLLRVFALFSQKHPQAVLRIGGGSEESIRPYRKLAKQLGISAQVQFLGTLERTEVGREMAQAHVFVLLSELEAAGTVIAEAESCGTPVVATLTWGGRSYTLEEYRFLAPVGNIEEIAHQLERVYQQAPPGEQIRDLAKKRFSTEVFVRNSELLYAKAQEKFLSANRHPQGE
ncbi:glycosyltransferase [Actinomycetaceae bacterium TAE3-ERU4]|nr:glycosyltransferase [Actinomycetaceae bacterium TAE3-ERU4]